jgi:hypothetical protein
MNVPFLVAGALALGGAAVHGAGGELLVVRRIDRSALPPSVFGGRSATMLMIRVTWHLTTLAFVALGSALVICGSVGPGAACRAVGLVAGSAYSAFAVLTIGVTVHQEPRALLRHPAPVMFVVVAALTWWGTF